MHFSLVGLLKEMFQIFIASIAGRHLAVIRHIIPCIPKGGEIAGIQPEGVAAQLPDIVQFSDNTWNIPDSVPVAVTKTLGINFIKYTIFQPIRHVCPASLEYFSLVIIIRFFLQYFYCKNSR
jgi:hypothetical protein